MKDKQGIKYFRKLLVFGLAISAFSSVILAENPVLAEIKADTSLGGELSIFNQGVEVKGAIGDRIDGGAVRGANLFHSFQEFSLDNGQRVYFSNPSGVQNIFTRVTGNNRSEILGTLGVLGNANLFLINPNGILFGANASLDIAGSFVTTTADSLVFENGLIFSAKNPQTVPLLVVNVPLGLQFGTQPAAIQVQAASLVGGDDKTLALVGGDVSIDRGLLWSFGGRIELGGLSSQGIVGLEFSDRHVNFQFPESAERADVFLDNRTAIRAFVNEITGNSGSIAINTRDLQLFNFSQLTFINETSENTQGKVLINASNSVFLDGSRIGSLVAPETVGKGADVIFKTGSLSLINGAQIYAITLGTGNSGNININTSNSVTLGHTDDSNSSFTAIATQSIGEGKSGNLTLVTDKLSLSNSAQIGSATFGQGNVGKVTIIANDSINLSERSLLTTQIARNAQGNGEKLSITTKSLILTDSDISTTTLGQGNAGDLEIIASDSVIFDATNASAGVFSRVAPRAIGQGGDISITTNSFSLLNQAQVDASTIGEGGGGNVSITTQILSAKNGSQISAGTVGQGNAGNIIINASDTANFDGVNNTFKDLLDGSSIEYIRSGIFTLVSLDAVGKGGDLTINTGNLTVTNGATLSSATLGQGEAGNIDIHARNSIWVDGLLNNDYLSTIESSVDSRAVGNGGTIKLTAKNLAVTNRALINASTAGLGNAGNIEIIADKFEAASGGRLLASTSSSNKAGNITLMVSDRVTLAGDGSGIFANTTANASGDSGSIFIDPKEFIIRDRAKVAVDNQGSGIGGTIDIQAGRLTLDNQATISAETASNSGGNIRLQLNDLLLLRRNSVISTTAGTTQAGGNGGNIRINAPFIIAAPLENNDITANAFNGSGGKIDITAQSILGLTSRTRADIERLLATNDPNQLNPRSLSTSDITAISQANPSLNGQVLINTPDLDPDSGLVALPENVVEASKLIAQTCRGAGEATASQQSEFVVTGRGGLPSKPSDPSSSDAIWQDLQSYKLPKEKLSSSRQETSSVSPQPTAIIEAQGWVTSIDGKITLLAQAPTTTPHHSSLTSVSCPFAQN
ncbi:filamentous hemagglutinin N-terminal domain-containing protein [Anabaena minutissima FACHB-250]|nr:filamentous hemagglutinin N-terminal domain-containing protein [Anabaena minutissima FACHB-250]